jgi:hypothetical protein
VVVEAVVVGAAEEDVEVEGAEDAADGEAVVELLVVVAVGDGLTTEQTPQNEMRTSVYE